MTDIKRERSSRGSVRPALARSNYFIFSERGSTPQVYMALWPRVHSTPRQHTHRLSTRRSQSSRIPPHTCHFSFERSLRRRPRFPPYISHIHSHMLSPHASSHERSLGRLTLRHALGAPLDALSSLVQQTVVPSHVPSAPLHRADGAASAPGTRAYMTTTGQ